MSKPANKKGKKKKEDSIAKVFFGTPRRAAFTVGGIFVVVGAMFPSLVIWLLQRFLTAVSPVITVLFVLGIGVIAFKRMTGGSRK